MKNILISKKAQQRSGFIGTLIKIIIGIGMLYAAYLLFKYALRKGDWDFIMSPLKNLIGYK